jgi:F-type H+-transporting ATPase subunit b
MEPLFILLSGKAPPLVDIDATVFIQLGIFLLLLVVLTRFVFRPYLALRSERTAKIDGAQAEAQKLSQDADAKLTAYEAKILAVRKEAATVRAQIRAEGDARAAELLGTARSDSQTTVEAARQKLERSTQAAALSLRTKADQIADAIVSKLLGREV